MVFRRSSESLRDYTKRFKREVNNAESPSDESILTAISMGLPKDEKLYESIYMSPVRDLGEFYERAKKEIRWEETFGSKKPSNPKDGGGSANQSKKRGNGDNDKGGQWRNPNNQDIIFVAEKGKENFGRPNPLQIPNRFRNKDKFCAYHSETGHNTSKCWALRDPIEELIKRDHLRDYVVRSGDQQPQHPVQLEPRQAPEQDRAPTGTPLKKARTTPSDIVFTKEDTKEVHWPYNDALVVRARINNVEVRRIMVDTRSSMNVMYRGCFNQMGLGSDQLTASPELLYGFTGDAVTPTRRIRLPLTIGDSHC
ncbi:uncharacterized protein LOC127799827 [Diospyros lotus]|uniref:uncharacterized protein LOC127799827 n=1 Tax=Diospyros lotus TaxID=55363 RepID=UPI0022557B76|nr:uncharacterized protein LOC127799827 [Diospyros lotus]